MKVNEVNKWLFEVEHPAKGDKNIVELGMVENVEIGEGSVTVTLAFSKHRDPLAGRCGCQLICPIYVDPVDLAERHQRWQRDMDLHS